MVRVSPTLRIDSITMKPSRRVPRAASTGLLAPNASSLPGLSPLGTSLAARMAHTGKQHTPTPDHLPILPPPAAGSAVGAEKHGGGVPADRDAQPVPPCSAFPCDVHRLADWFPACRSTTGVLASTGVGWMPLSQLLEARGFAGAFVNARHVQQVPGRPKTDRWAGRWLQKLQRYGWLAPSFRPPAHLGPRRRLLRHRDPLLQMSVTPRQHRHKARDHRHLHLHHVRRAVTGVTGMRMLRAIVASARPPQT